MVFPFVPVIPITFSSFEGCLKYSAAILLAASLVFPTWILGTGNLPISLPLDITADAPFSIASSI